MTDLDMVNRDPNAINSHLECAFEDVIAEPDAVHSIECVWRLAYSCFNCWKNCCYKVSTLLCGMCIAASWGCDFACLTFTHVWCYTPNLKKLSMNCLYFQRIWAIYIGCCLDPLCTSCGQIFHAFKKS